MRDAFLQRHDISEVEPSQPSTGPKTPTTLRKMRDFAAFETEEAYQRYIAAVFELADGLGQWFVAVKRLA